MRKRNAVLFVWLFMSVAAQAKPLTIAFWHSFAGYLGSELTKLCDKYNASQSKFRIKPIYKGSYPETLTSYVAAFRARKKPAIVQIFEIGTATMLHPKGVIVPLYKVLADAGIDESSIAILPTIRRYYGDDKGRLLAMPFNSSTPVLFYNKEAFKRAGIKKPPATWKTLAKDAKQLLGKGKMECGFTTTYPSWIHLESFTALHGLTFVDGKGIDDLKVRLNYDLPEVNYHINRLRLWQKLHIFKYGGRDSDAAALFTSGHCAMLTQSSGSYIGLKQIVPFELGVAPLPVWPHLQRKKGNTVIGGAALWVSSGFDKKTYQGVAEFLTFLARPQNQAAWQKATGYLAVTQKAHSKLNNNDDALLASNIAIKQISRDKKQSAGARLGAYAQIRLYNDEQLEAAIASIKPVKTALKDAVRQGNYLLRRFEQNVKD